MSRNGLAIFVIFFGVSLLDAVSGGRWVSVFFWFAVGVIFALLRTGRKYALALESPPPASCRSKSPRDTNPSDPACLRGQPRQASSLGAGVNYGGPLSVPEKE